MNANDANLLRAIRWPVTLITLGTLFALNNFTNYGFDRTWPVLLIVFGLLSLLGRTTAGPPAGAPPYGTRAGGAR
jgi:cell wall-active antibiotic response 4TMS protein YvqF